MSTPTVSKKILVVEDDPAIRRLLEATLANAGFLVVLAEDGEAGLVAAVRERPDVVLLDVNLPKLDGYSVAKRIKGTDALKNTPIVFLTARDRPADMISGIQAGARHYLTKPFKAAELLAKLNKLLGA